jgi:hypothetical protein
VPAVPALPAAAATPAEPAPPATPAEPAAPATPAAPPPVASSSPPTPPMGRVPAEPPSSTPPLAGEPAAAGAPAAPQEAGAVPAVPAAAREPAAPATSEKNSSSSPPQLKASSTVPNRTKPMPTCRGRTRVAARFLIVDKNVRFVSRVNRSRQRNPPGRPAGTVRFSASWRPGRARWPKTVADGAGRAGLARITDQRRMAYPDPRANSAPDCVLAPTGEPCGLSRKPAREMAAGGWCESHGWRSALVQVGRISESAPLRDAGARSGVRRTRR